MMIDEKRKKVPPWKKLDWVGFVQIKETDISLVTTLEILLHDGTYSLESLEAMFGELHKD